MAEDFRSFVTAKEVLAVVKQIYEEDVDVLDFEVEKATSSVQGFMSNILRVTFRAKVGKDGNEVASKFVIKRKPTLESQQSVVDEMLVFDQEIGFFKQCAPILRERCPDLPAVRCYLTDEENSVIYMEDLKKSGFASLVVSICDLKESILTLDHMNLVMKTMAKFHSASIGIDWVEKAPSVFTEDIMFSSGGKMMKKFIHQSAENALIPITEYHFKGNDYYLKSSQWVSSEEFFEILHNICKPDPKGMNVVCQGDSWVNNMMFKIDPESGKPVEIKLIDFQICRFTRGNRDLMDFMYMVCTPDFRKENEKELLLTYWNTFTAACKDQGVAVQQDWEQFYEDYDKNRAFGLVMAVCMRPSIYVKGTFPDGNDALTDDHINSMLEGGSGPNETIREFQENPKFRREMLSFIEETSDLYYKYYA